LSGSSVSSTRPLRRYEGLPRSEKDLNMRLRNCLNTKDPAFERRMRVTLANVIVGQMLPESAVKGGTAMKVRLGHDGSRFTPDLDTARKSTVTIFLAEFRANLEKGWHGFTGRVVERPAPRPAGVPTAYVMAAVRLFDYRRAHAWPPTVVAGEEWKSIYAEAADGLAVLPDVDDAVAWANDLVAKIDDAG
jgi:hypothetical protein